MTLSGVDYPYIVFATCTIDVLATMQDIIVDRLRREFNVQCGVGAPQVNYRESISRPADVRYIHKKQSGGSGQFADVAIRFTPGEPGSGFEFRSEIKGGVVSDFCCVCVCQKLEPVHDIASQH